MPVVREEVTGGQPRPHLSHSVPLTMKASHSRSWLGRGAASVGLGWMVVTS